MPIKKERLKKIVIPSSMILIISLIIMVSLSIKEKRMVWAAYLVTMNGILLIGCMIYSLLYRPKKYIFNKQGRVFTIFVIVTMIIYMLLSVKGKGDLMLCIGCLFMVECIGWIMCFNENITDNNQKLKDELKNKGKR